MLFRSLIKADSLEELRKDLIDISIAQMRLREIEAGHYEQYSKTEFLDKLEIWKKNR